MIDTRTIEQTVRSTIAEVLDVDIETLAAQPLLTAHRWDSFSTLHVLAELEARLESSFDLRTVTTARTVDDVVALAVSAATS